MLHVYVFLGKPYGIIYGIFSGIILEIIYEIILEIIYGIIYGIFLELIRKINPGKNIRKGVPVVGFLPLPAAAGAE